MRLTINGLENCPCPMCTESNEGDFEKKLEKIASCHPNAFRKALEEMESDRQDFIKSLPRDTNLPERFI